MTTYNGHKNWNYWNVSLWINNDEGLYNKAHEFVRECGSKAKAAELMLGVLREHGYEKTPDGAPYTKSAVRAAMSGME